jgi:hypothetical protein
MPNAATSALQFEEVRPNGASTVRAPEKDLAQVTTDSPTDLKSPSFEYGSAWAASSRRAGRINAASIPDDELQSLLLQRQHLLDKKFEGSISRPEEIKLEYIGWSLDRIEDARHGAHLDRLENAVERYEDLKGDINALMAQLNELKSGKR